MSDESSRKPAKDYQTVTADSSLEADLRSLVRLSIAEDLRDSLDWTTVCLIEPESRGGCQLFPEKKVSVLVSLLCRGLSMNSMPTWTLS